MTLQALFQFDDADLAANRGGTLSPSQWEQYRAWIPLYRRRMGVFSLAILSIALIGFFGGAGFYALSVFEDNPDLPQGLKPVVVAALFLMAGGIFLVRLRALKQENDLEDALETDGKVHVIQGQVEVRAGGAGGILEFWVDGKPFATTAPLNPEMQHAFDPNRTYTVYYLNTPTRPMILSIE